MTKPGSVLKAERAYQHVIDAKRAADQFLNSDPYDIERDEESKPGKLLFWITLRKEPPPEIALAAGDAIHNLRSALDHIVYELSSKRKANPRDTSFPLLINEKDWESGLDRVRLLPDDAIKLIHDLQPWPRPRPFWPDLFGPNRKRLRELHDLDIADKHKNLNLAVLYVDMIGIGTKGESDVSFEYVHRGPLQVNEQTLLLRLDYPTKEQVQPLPALDVVFSEGPTPNEPVGNKLDELFRNTIMVLNALSRFA